MSFRSGFLAVSLLAVSLLAASCASSIRVVEHPHGKLPPPDFAVRAARLDAAAIELSREAFERARDGAVRDLARDVELDLSGADGELRTLAWRRGWDLPDSPDADARIEVDHLEHVPGGSFDALYLQSLDRVLVAEVSACQHAVRTHDDPELRAWARRTLKALERNQDAMPRARAEVGAVSTELR